MKTRNGVSTLFLVTAIAMGISPSAISRPAFFSQKETGDTSRLGNTISADARQVVTVEQAERWKQNFASFQAAFSQSAKNKAVEIIADDWAMWFADQHGWTRVLTGQDKRRPQGLDQVWIKPDGKNVVIEVKGNTSKTITAYGERQGTPEWAVKSARATLVSPTASTLEKVASRSFLENASRGNAECYLIRVRQSGGIATGLEIEKNYPITRDAIKLAKQSLAETAGTATASSLANQQTRTVTVSAEGSTGKKLAPTRIFAKVPCKGLGAVGAIASIVQLHDGVQELKAGKPVEGSANLVGGAANATSAIAGLAGRVVLSGGAGAVGAGIDGAVDVYHGIKNGDVEKTAIGSIKSAAAITMGAGVATVQPEIVVGGAIVYGGAVVTDVVYQDSGAICGAGNKVIGKAQNWIDGSVEDWEVSRW
jgi:hypothetical protein